MLEIKNKIEKFMKNKTIQNFIKETWPEIKRFLAKYISKGHLTLIEKFYNKLDASFNTGVVITKIDEVSSKDVEKNLAKADAVSVKLPQLMDIFHKLNIFATINQKRIGTCAIWTFNNMVVWTMLRLGLKPQKDITNITLNYRDLKWKTGDTGTVVLDAIKKITKKGMTIKTVDTIYDRKNLSDVEKDKAIENGWKYTFKFFTGKIKQAKNFNDAVKLDRELSDNYVIQVSATWSDALKWFGAKIPFLDNTKSFTRTGGHSVFGVRGSFSEYKDKKGFVILDSAYYSYEGDDKNNPVWRFITEKLVNAGIVRVRFVEVDIKGLKTIAPTIKPYKAPKYTKLAKNIFKFKKWKNNIKMVKAIQGRLRLVEDGIFGNQTEKVIKNFQRHNGLVADGVVGKKTWTKLFG